jgi:D-lactate dehydrogenase
LLGCDINENEELVKKYGLKSVSIKHLCKASDIITLLIPLNTATKHLINKELFDTMKPGVMFINTARGAIIKTEDAIDALDDGIIGSFGLDVYEKEKGIFFYDLSKEKMKDEVLIDLMNRPNVIITPHQAFATKEALGNISDATFYNVDCSASGKRSPNEINVS